MGSINDATSDRARIAHAPSSGSGRSRSRRSRRWSRGCRGSNGLTILLFLSLPCSLEVLSELFLTGVELGGAVGDDVS